MRNYWLKAHLYLALTVGFVFVILGLTGSANVFMTELEEIGLPKVEQNTSAKPVSLTQIMATVKAAHPQREDRWTLSMPGHDRDYIWVGYAKPKETADEFFAPLRVLVHPYTGEIVSQSFWGQTLWSLIYEVHADLLMGKFGTDIGKTAFKIVCFLGIFLLVSALTGLYLWWPKNRKKFKQSITIKRHASKQRFYFDLHNTTGFYSAIFLIITAFSGISFAYYKDYIKPMVILFSEVKADHHKEPKELKSKRNRSAEPITPDQAVAIADKVFPHAQLRWIANPEGNDGIYAIEKRQAGEANYRRPRSKVWIDQYSGEVLKIENPNQFTAGETFLNLMWPLHSGEALGFPGRILWCILGFAPLVLYVTGILRWLQKRKATRFLKQQQGRLNQNSAF